VSVRTHPGRWLSAQGHYAGSVSRFAAYLIDLAVSTVIYWLALQFVSFVAQIVTGSPISWHRDNIVATVIYVVWEFVYFGFQWAANGRTFGMALLGVHVVRADGARMEPWRGWVRSLTFPLGFLTLGLGFLGILVQREHRAVYDLIAGTAVVYAWDARAARLRFLARQAEPIADAASTLPPLPPPAEPVTAGPSVPTAVTADVSDRTEPIAVTVDRPGPDDLQTGPHALAEPGQQHPEPSSKGDA
jgi:uncharacterized RDD family membrane protein YckC